MLGPWSVSVISTLLPTVCSKVSDIQAKVDNMGEKSIVFSGGAIHLRCIILDERSTWKPFWLRNNKTIAAIAEGEVSISPAQAEHSGSYSCYGFRETELEDIQTSTSPPLKISVYDGPILIQLNRETVLVGGTLEAQCRVRDNPRLGEVWFYRDNVLVLSRKDGKADLRISQASLTHQGTYTCRASWQYGGKLRVADSAGVLVTVKEVLNEPKLTLEPDTTSRAINLRCVFQFYKEDPETQVHVYFYRNGRKLAGIGRSEQNPTQAVLNIDGWYGCKARVPALGLVRWSRLTKYGNPSDELREQALAQTQTL